MSSLKISGLVKHFDKVQAINGLDMEVEKGEFFALLGPSASGKTTTFRSICGMEKPDAGQVEINGQDVTDAPMRDRGVAMVFQTFALYPHLTIYDNLAFPLRQIKTAESEIKTRIGEISELLKLGHALERKPGTASGGEQQRIAIGRALIRRPDLLLLDEPLTNLDAKLRHDMRAEFKRIHRERNITIIYATPDELEALTMGDRIGVLRDGQMVQVGTPDSLYDTPDNSYVAGMVGSPQMNLISGVRRGTDSQASIAVPFGEFSAQAWSPALKDFSGGEDLLLGLRPHEIVPLDSAADAKGPTFDCEVHLTEPLGDVVILDLIAGEARLKMVLPEEQAVTYKIGDRLTCGFDLEKSHVFAKETGTAIR
ncbi:ABC transporter ATP-binding protein [Rhodovibrionaceae bacterium A322]